MSATMKERPDKITLGGDVGWVDMTHEKWLVTIVNSHNAGHDTRLIIEAADKWLRSEEMPKVDLVLEGEVFLKG